MGTKLTYTYEYDSVGNTLYIDRVPPYREQESDALGDNVIARFNPATGEIENVEICFFSKRLHETEALEVILQNGAFPVTARDLQGIIAELRLQ